MIERDMLKEYAAGFGVTLDTAQLDAFDRYAALLVEWKAKMVARDINSWFRART